MTTTTRNARFALTALMPLLVLTAAPSAALAQEDPQQGIEATDSNASKAVEAERAFLRAYYLEIGEQQQVRALDDYRRVLSQYPDAPVVPRVWIAIARVLEGLGRRDEALAALDHVQRAFPADARAVAAASALRAQMATPRDDDLTALVRAALAQDAWETRVPSFGPRAVPVLMALLRAADPSVVYRAGRSLLHIARDGDAAACDTLLAALTAKDVLYPEDLREKALQDGLLPDRLGRGILALEDAELRDRLVVLATVSSAADRQEWLVQAIQDDPHSRALVFPDEPNGRGGTAALIVRAVCLGPGPARDAALARLQLYEPRTTRRERGDTTSLGDEDPFFDPPAAFLADREALRTAVGHVYDESPRERPSETLLEAMLRDPETRALGLAWTWLTGTPVKDRALLVDALSKGWNIPEGKVGNCANTVARSFDTPPTREEWERMLDGYTGKPFDLLQMFASRKLLTTDALDACIARGDDGGHLDAAVGLAPKLGDPEWAARALPPLLRSDTTYLALSAAHQLLDLHRAGKIDVAGAADDLLRLVRRSEAWERNPTSSSGVVKALAGELGDVARRTLVDALPLGNDGDYYALDTLNAADAAETIDVARRMLFVELASGVDPRQSLVNRAAIVLVQRAGDEALPDLMRAARSESERRRWYASSAVFANAASSLSSEATERWYASLIDDMPDGVVLPNHWAGMDVEAVRRLALKALASEDTRIQLWGAMSEKSLLDPAAAEALGRLATSPVSDVRAMAREALSNMRKAEDDLAWMRAVAARRATRGRVDGYLASGDPKERMAGVAGLVALRAADALERLLEVAAKDVDADVRSEARRALMALGDRQGDGPADEE